jgi:hypothetical protein
MTREQMLERFDDRVSLVDKPAPGVAEAAIKAHLALAMSCRTKREREEAFLSVAVIAGRQAFT